VSRLLPYKNIGAVIEAFARRPGLQLVVVGTGPQSEELKAAAPANVRLLGQVADEELRWLYGASEGLVAASYEDFGLTPIEAAAFGRPTAALRWGGFLDTIVEGTTGVFFDEPTPDAIAAAVDELVSTKWSAEALEDHAGHYAPGRFLRSVAAVVDELQTSR
jgi:glycosyltransferase involved in cell wall biosynthesis